MESAFLQINALAMFQEIGEPEQLLAAILRVSSDHIFVSDRAGRYLAVGQAASDALQLAPWEILGRTAADLELPPAFLAKLAREREYAFVSGNPVEGEDVIPGPDGQARHYHYRLTPLLDVGGKVYALLGTARDVTETFLADQNLRLKEENLALAVGAAHLGTFYCEWPFDKIIWNETCKQHFFLSPEAEVDFDLFYSLLHPDDRENTRDAVNRAMDEREEYNVEYRVLAPDGRSRWINAIGRGFYNEEGIPIRFDGVTMDITERKRAEEERERLQKLTELRAAELAESFQKEHRIAEALQRSLLNRPIFTQDAPVEVETIYKPAWDEAEVGGDYYDVFALDAGNLALVIGDVSGKGLEAASRTAEIKYTLRAYLREYPHAAPALQRLNTFLCETQALEEGSQSYFVCITLIILDTITGTAQVAVGGAEPPLVLRARGRIEEVRASGLPLGAAGEADYQSQSVTLSHVDLLLLVTDGITEARRGREFLGWEGMTQLAQEARGSASLEELGQAVFAGAERFAGGRLKDDACLLLARRM